MLGNSAINSQSEDLKEKLLNMLEWTKPCLVPSKIDPIIHQEKTIAFGAWSSSQWAKNANNTLFVAFSGTLFQREKLPKADSDAEQGLKLNEMHKENSFKKLAGQFS